MVQNSVAHVLIFPKYNKPYTLGERPVPPVNDSDVLIRVHAAGFCHSDLQTLQGQFNSPIGLIPSHEAAGTVAELGIKYSGDLKVGDRVGTLNFKHACGSCTGCGLTLRTKKKLDPRFCDNRETAGFQHDGAFADYLVADPTVTIKLPHSLSFAQAAPLMCAGATAWGSLEKATEGLDTGETVAIVGVGGLGHLGMQFAKAMGYRTIAVDSRLAGQQLAREVPSAELQPDLVVDSSAPDDATQAIFDFTSGEGVAAAVVCTDSLAANRWALKLLRVGGTLGLLGLPADPWQFDSDLIVFRELTIRGSYVASREATERMLEAVDRLGIRSHITSIPFSQIPGIVEMYEDNSFKGRLVVEMGNK